MASSASKPALVKQLKELLQEQQEPFELSTYLLERRYTMKKSSSDDGNHYCLTSSTENLKEPHSPRLNKKRILLAPRTLKWMLYKLITPNHQQELSTCSKAVKDKLISETIDMIQQIAETNWFSTVSNVTALGASSDCGAPEVNPSSEHHTGSLLAETFQALNVRHFEDKKPATDIHQQRGCMDDDKQLSPVIVLQDLTSDKGTSTSRLILTQTKGKSMFSALPWKLLLKSKTRKHIPVGFTEVKEIIHSTPWYPRNMRVLQQSKQLLFNCNTKAIKYYIIDKGTQKLLHKFYGLEELERIISEQLCSWGKQQLNATNAANLIYLEFSATAEEWNYFQNLKPRIGREMGDSIMDEMIGELIDWL